MPDIAIESAIRTLPQTKNADLSRSIGQGRPDVAAKREAAELRNAASTIESDETPTQVPRERTLEALERLQSYADRLNRNLEFSVDDSSGRTVVTVRDGSTEEVIRQIPSEEALRLANDIDSSGVSFLDFHA